MFLNGAHSWAHTFVHPLSVWLPTSRCGSGIETRVQCNITRVAAVYINTALMSFCFQFNSFNEWWSGKMTLTSLCWALSSSKAQEKKKRERFLCSKEARKWDWEWNSTWKWWEVGRAQRGAASWPISASATCAGWWESHAPSEGRS